jgi:uncharacterized membrane protein
MKLLKVMLFLTVFLLMINISTAYSLDSYNTQYNIVGNKVVMQTIITASETIILSLPIPADAETVEVYLNDVKFDATIEDNFLRINLNRNDQLKIGYITSEFIDKSNFLLNLPIGYDVGLLKITLVLPEEAVLRRPIKDTTGSIYPKPDQATTDGRSLIFIWEREDLKSGDEIAIFAMYKTKFNYIPFIVALAAIIFVLLLYVLRKLPKKEVKKEEKKPELEKHLKEEEQQIVSVLKQREGQCEQGTLRVITGFSKAHLSRLLMELEARKIIYKEKRGKKNLIFLK